MLIESHRKCGGSEEQCSKTGYKMWKLSYCGTDEASMLAPVLFVLSPCVTASI